MNSFIKVVSAEEMTRIEQSAIAKGSDAADFMLEAGKKSAQVAVDLLQSKKKVVLLIGKGNKGGDAYVAGIHLLQKGYFVRAIAFEDSSCCSKLNRRFSKEFVQAKGIVQGPEALDFSQDDLIIDGLFGTGFQGSCIEGSLAIAIDLANGSNKPILSIDIPSGLNSTTGKTANHVITATVTATIGLYKIGFFINDGYNHVGKIQLIDFGLPQEAIEKANALALIPKLESLELPAIHRVQHKYQRGFVLGFGGSAAFKGAAKLSASAALHAGAGIVKLFTLEEIGPVADEIICQIWNVEAWNAALTNASALFIGPGLGKSETAQKWIETCLPNIEKPCVIDADALFFLRELPKWPKQCILTPHHGEMLALLGKNKKDLNQETLLQESQQFVDERKTIVILKGAPTFILSPNSVPIIIPYGDPGMATAGSGDVLTGILAALLAQRKPLLGAAVLGVVLHALSGESASQEKTSYGYTASDLIECLPKAFTNLIK